MTDPRGNRDFLRTCGITRLETQSIEEEVKEDSVTGGAGGVRASAGIETVRTNKASVDVVEHISPHLTDVYTQRGESTMKE